MPREFLEYLKPYRNVFGLLIVLTLATGVLGPSRPLLIQHALDDYAALGDYYRLIRFIVGMLTLLVIQIIVEYYLAYLSDWLGQHVVSDLRIKLYNHTIRLPTAFYHKTPVGQLVTRNVSDMEALANVFSEGLATLLADLLKLGAMVLFMLYIDWQLAICTLAVLPCLYGTLFLLKKKLRSVYKQLRDALAQLNSFVQVRLTNMNIIQIFNREQRDLLQFDALNTTYKDVHNRSIGYYGLYFPMLEMIRAISICCMFGYGTYSLLGGHLTLGKITAFLMYITMFFRPLYYLIERFSTLQMGLASMDRIRSLLSDQQPLANQGVYVPKTLLGDIQFERIWFAYQDAHYVLQDISLHIPAKQSVAIVGGTGAGKSTLVSLLTRFYHPQQGRICLDGVDIKEYELHALRKHIGLVLQDVFLLSTSIHNNITLYNEDISRAQVIEAARLLGIHDFIQHLPDTYDYEVQERGMVLSTGQRQLLAFARVLVYNPCILILDEATASMDTATEALIQRATTQVLRSRTAIIIAHRLATIRHADQIVVLDHGKVCEIGTHASLLAKKGTYAALYKAQYAGTDA
ncbi:MAG: ABC transporter ATP-binding protein [Bacteroidota bacterium]